MFYCLSSLGLISLLTFSEFSLFICKWKTSERLVNVGVGVGVDREFTMGDTGIVGRDAGGFRVQAAEAI